jgi:quercetin dioxygenase-like cupin family protein
MYHFPSGSRPTRRASSDWFTGTVWQDPIVEAETPARVRAATVHFEPGARTNWHTHPLGQTLLVTAGRGLAQSSDGSVFVLRPGDTLWIPPGEKHWHGASPENAMSHIAIHEALDGKHIDWLEPVTDEQYLAAAGTT